LVYAANITTLFLLANKKFKTALRFELVTLKLNSIKPTTTTEAIYW